MESGGLGTDGRPRMPQAATDSQACCSVIQWIVKSNIMQQRPLTRAVRGFVLARRCLCGIIPIRLQTRGV